jgi:hypothetical protein
VLKIGKACKWAGEWGGRAGMALPNRDRPATSPAGGTALVSWAANQGLQRERSCDIQALPARPWRGPARKDAGRNP